MQFGVNLLNFGPSGDPGIFRDWAQTVEGLGYHSLLISDHVAVTPFVRQRYPEPFYDPFTVLGWLAGQTSRVKLGTTVCVLPYRHPILLARITANLDHLSGGRLIFGVGVGSSEDEYGMLGQEFHRRGAAANEYLEAVYLLWGHGGDAADYHGRYVDFEGISGIRPLQAPHPPVWVGGLSEAAMRRTLRFDAAWHPNRFTLPWLRDTGVPAMRRIAEEMGRPVPAFCPRIPFKLTEQPVSGDDRPSGVGTLEQVRGDLKELEALGAEHIIFDRYVAGDLEGTRDHEAGLRMLKTAAEQLVDLPNERLR